MKRKIILKNGCLITTEFKFEFKYYAKYLSGNYAGYSSIFYSS